MDTFLFTKRNYRQQTNGIIISMGTFLFNMDNKWSYILWTLFSSPYRNYNYSLFSSPYRQQTELYFYGTLFSSPYGQQMELYFYGHFSLHHMDNGIIIWNYIENKRNIIMDTFLFTYGQQMEYIYMDNKRNYIYMDTFLTIHHIWTYGQQTELYLYGHFSLHLIDNKRNYIYVDTVLFTIQTTNGIIFIWTLFSSPYRQQTELYFYGHFSLHHIGQQTELYLYGHFSLHLIDNKRNDIYMDTFLFTLQTTNGIIFIWTLFSSPYRQQTELYLYGHFSLHHIDNKRNDIYMDTFLFTLQTTNGIIFIWTLFSSPCRQQTELF